MNLTKLQLELIAAMQAGTLLYRERMQIQSFWRRGILYRLDPIQLEVRGERVTFEGREYIKSKAAINTVKSLMRHGLLEVRYDSGGSLNEWLQLTVSAHQCQFDKIN